MILFILAILIFLVLLLATFINFPRKLLTLCLCVCLLVIVNFLNEIQAFNQPQSREFDLPSDRPKIKITVLKPESWESWQGSSQEYIWGQLLQEQKSYANILNRNWQQKQYGLLYFEGLPSPRLKMILNMLVNKANSTNKLDVLELYVIDYEKSKCNIYCLESSFSRDKDKYRLLIAKNIQQSQDITNLRQIYFDRNISIIFENPKQAYRYNTINRFVEHYYFSNNYISKFIGHYSEKVIENCLTYRSFDYDLYITSHLTPLEELCSRQVPLTKFDRCVQKLFNGRSDPIPIGWARPCFPEAQRQVINERNGWLYPKKSYNRGKVGAGVGKGEDL